MEEDTCANPLLLGWIKEWLDEARNRNSKGASVYKKAYDSMKACPLTFSHPSEAQQLHGFGPKLCDRLADKLKKHCAENGLPMPEPPAQAARKRNSKEAESAAEGQPAKKTKKAKPYVPTLRSGPYGLLLGLATLDENSNVGLTKAQLIEIAQPYCDASFTAPPDPTKFYTAWNSMKTLVQKDLVYEHGRPQRRYLLTDEGWKVAKRIKNTVTRDGPSARQSSIDQQLHEPDVVPSRSKRASPSRRPIPLAESNSQPTRRGPSVSRNRCPDIEDPDFLEILSSPDPEPLRHISNNNQRQPSISHSTYSSLNNSSSTTFTLPPDSFTIQLILDVREIRTVKDRDYISNELAKKGIKPIVRSLEVGDALWVAKCKDPNYLAQYGEEGDEVMLDWIIERKRLDDLLFSIKDGRFHEQKFRLRRSGVKNVVYLIEEFSLPDSAGAGGMRHQEAIASAIASTQVVNGYFVKKTSNLDDTIRYLARMTTLLQTMYTNTQPTTAAKVSRTRLSVIRTRNIDSSESYLPVLNQLRQSNNSDNTTYTTTFATFSALSSKSDVLSLRDLYLKMLMCTRGVTGDKALEIQKRWRTPREFVEAFQLLDTGGEEGKRAMDEMVSKELSGLVGRKKVAKVLSKKIAEVWGQIG